MVNFRYVCRAYVTLFDYGKQKSYDTEEKWISNLPIVDYTLQQLAAEPSLFHGLKGRLRNGTLKEIDAQARSQTKSIELKVPLTTKKTIETGSLRIDFSSGCINKNLTIAIRTLFSPDYRTYGLLKFICLFKTDIYHGSNKL
jgi:hypothetical protein